MKDGPRLPRRKALAVLMAGGTAGLLAAGSLAQPQGASAAAEPPIQCPSATLTNTDPQLQEGFRLALSQACVIMESQPFRRTVEASRLARKCPSLFSKHKRIAGAEIYRRLASGMPVSFTVTAEDLSGSTVAVTNAYNRSMSIEPWKLTAFAGGDASDRAGTVNTLVHEMTHLVPDAGGGSYFQDGWQWTPWCDAEKLVSYNLGNDAETQWTRAQPN
jgi:hypothetical protein